jgi:hypothetical protein
MMRDEPTCTGELDLWASFDEDPVMGSELYLGLGGISLFIIVKT